MSKWQTAALYPEIDPFDEIKPINIEGKVGSGKRLIVLSLPEIGQVSSNVRRITVSTDFDRVTDIQVRQFVRQKNQVDHSNHNQLNILHTVQITL